MFEKPVGEKDFKRLKNIQMGSLLPVFLVLIFFLFTKDILFLLCFFFLLIIGVFMPWAHREILSSHLILLKKIDHLQELLERTPKQDP